MRIDPKAPANSPAHPANWRQPVFSQAVPASVPAPLAEAEAPAAQPVKKAAKKPATRRKASDLAAALAKLGDQ